jgi:hypothetical protein
VAAFEAAKGHALASPLVAGPSGPEVQKQALNGTQITSLTALAEAAATMALPKESVKAIIAAGFPTLEQDTINAIIDPIVPEKPAPPIIPPAVGPDGKPLPPKPGQPAAPKPGEPAAPAQPKPGDNVVPIKKKAVGAQDMFQDAKPRTAYVRRDLLNAGDFITWAKSQGFDTTLAADDLHVTILYSKASVDWMTMGSPWGSERGELRVQPGGPRVVEALGDKGAVGLLFQCDELKWRHEQMVRDGASHDFPEYQPHVTITWDAGDLDLSTVEPYQGELLFGPEIWEEIDAEFDPSQLKEDSRAVLDAVTGVLEKQGKLVSDAMRAALESQPAPVVNVHLPQAPDRKPVVKDMEYDEKNRVTRITEREEGDAE